MTAWLLERFGEYTDAPALIDPQRTPRSYRWLLDQIAQAHRELDRFCVGPGASVGLLADYSPESCALLIALIERRIVVVPISPAVPNPELLMEIARVEHLLDMREGGALNHRERTAGSSHTLVERLRRDAESGLVLFTSGSTGEPKAALHSFDRLLEKFRARRPPLRTLAFLLIDHIGGINTLFHVLSNGGAIVAVGERDPDSICAEAPEIPVWAANHIRAAARHPTGPDQGAENLPGLGAHRDAG